MAKNMNKVQPGRLLSAQNNVLVYELSTTVPYWNTTSDVEFVMASFNSTGVAVRVSRGSDLDDMTLRSPAQVVLSREDFEKLIASYHAFERAEKKRLSGTSVPVADDFDPFLNSDDMP